MLKGGVQKGRGVKVSEKSHVEKTDSDFFKIRFVFDFRLLESVAFWTHSSVSVTNEPHADPLSFSQQRERRRLEAKDTIE